MSFDSLLINICTIWHYSSIASDDYNQPIKTWAPDPALTDIPCRLVRSSGTEIQVDKDVVVVNDIVFVKDIDITEQDRVVIDGTTYEVLLVKVRQDFIPGCHHKECALKVLR